MLQTASPKFMEFQFGNVVSDSFSHEAFTWERFDFPAWRRWMQQNFSVAVVLAVIYLVLVFSGKRWMANKQPLELRSCLVVWNITFTVFSCLAFWRTFPDLWAVLWVDGWHKSVCSRYHHVTTMLYTWFTFPEQEPCHRWLMTMNFFVHILMYFYFALKASGYKPPRLAAISLTTLQISQMIVGIFVNWYTWMESGSARGCERHRFNLIVAAIMYVSYFVLFANFFYTTYFKSIKKKRA